ncbi:GAF domain-containing sensor histidine kinase [soil metagenome]
MIQDAQTAIRDPERLQALRDTGLLDSEVEEQFDRLTRLASRLLGVPATFFSLVDEDRDFYKSFLGFPEPLSRDREMTGVTFCHYSLVSQGALVIPDTRADPVYSQVPSVESLGVAAYLGVPVRAPNGAVLGSFCAIDFQPHDWTSVEVETMKELAASAEREVAIRHWMRLQTELLERELAARRELEIVMESRARLMRGFTHDVKNPLGAGDGFLSLLEDEIVGPLTEKQKETVVRVRRAIGTAVDLINELIEIARTETGELVIERAVVDLRAVAMEIVEEYRAQAEAKELQIELAPQDALEVVQSDPTRIRQVLGNLVSNAVKYTHSGRVVVSAGLREEDVADVAEDDAAAIGVKWAILEVADTGPGIAREHMHLLFQEFTRMAPEGIEGAGLGLAISQRLAEAMGGRISVESEIDQGSRFTLWLPLVHQDESAGPGSPPPSQGPNDGSIGSRN